MTIPQTMDAVVQRRYGSPDDLSVSRVAVPEPGPAQVLVRVDVAALNPLDWHFVTGTPYLLRLMSGIRRPKRSTPGADVAGTVVAVGSSVDRFGVGDAVFGEVNGGTCAQYVVADLDGLAHKPEAVPAGVAGAVPVAGLTALQALRTHADLQPGERVLINGASGGVGTMAVQIAKAMGADVTGVCSTGKVSMVASIGADRVIDYTAEDFAGDAAVYDVIIDNVGNRTVEEIRSILAPTGRYVQISGPKDNPWLQPMLSVAVRALRFKATDKSFHQRARTFTARADHDDLIHLGELMASGALVPQVQRTVGLDGVAAGIAEIGTGRTRAKILVSP